MIRCENVTRDGDVFDVNIHVRAAKPLGACPAGAGKSVLLRVLSGQLAARGSQHLGRSAGQAASDFQKAVYAGRQRWSQG